MNGVTITELAKLAAPTDPSEVKTRAQNTRSGQIELSYVDARYVQELLDNVLEPWNWQSRFEDVENLDDGVRCGIGILVRRPHEHGDITEWLWKWDVGTTSDIEGTKGAHSDAFKRAAVQWGIARDLYDAQSETRIAVASRQGAPRPIRTTHTVNAQPGEDTPQQEELDPNDVAWACPIHQQVKIVPGGTSKKPPYKPYDAFYACPVRNCNETGRGIPVA